MDELLSMTSIAATWEGGESRLGFTFYRLYEHDCSKTRLQQIHEERGSARRKRKELGPSPGVRCI